MLNGYQLHDYVQAAIVIGVTIACMVSIIYRGTIPADLLPAWTIILGVYVGAKTSQTATNNAIAETKSLASNTTNGKSTENH